MSLFLNIKMSQNWNEIPLWEVFFGSFPIKTFIELGTGNGGMSTYFALQCSRIGAGFHTFDHEQWLDLDAPIQKMLNMQFHQMDIFSPAGIEYITGLIVTSPKPLALFCDNGNKPKEWATFAPLTVPGDYCIVHDWDVEFKQENLGNLPIERIMTEICDTRPYLDMKSMWFKRISNGYDSAT